MLSYVDRIGVALLFWSIQLPFLIFHQENNCITLSHTCLHAFRSMFSTPPAPTPPLPPPPPSSLSHSLTHSLHFSSELICSVSTHCFLLVLQKTWKHFPDNISPSIDLQSREKETTPFFSVLRFYISEHKQIITFILKLFKYYPRLTTTLDILHHVIIYDYLIIS